MADALEDREGTVSIGGRTITNLRFADDIDGLAGEEKELVNLVVCLDKASTAYGMKVSAEKTKLMTNKTSGINTEIKVNGQVHRKEAQSAVVWSCLPFIRSGRSSLSRHSERGKDSRQTEEKVGRQYQGVDRP